jgi:hypothetical protein
MPMEKVVKVTIMGAMKMAGLNKGMGTAILLAMVTIRKIPVARTITPMITVAKIRTIIVQTQTMVLEVNQVEMIPRALPNLETMMRPVIPIQAQVVMVMTRMPLKAGAMTRETTLAKKAIQGQTIMENPRMEVTAVMREIVQEWILAMSL